MIISLSFPKLYKQHLTKHAQNYRISKNRTFQSIKMLIMFPKSAISNEPKILKKFLITILFFFFMQNIINIPKEK